MWLGLINGKEAVWRRVRKSVASPLLRAANGAGVRYLMQPVSGCELDSGPEGNFRLTSLFTNYDLAAQNVSGTRPSR
jgi:hypothetical protein